CDYRGLDCEAVDTPDCSRCRYHFNFSCLSEDYLKSFRPSPLGRALFDLYNFKNIDIKFNNGDICLSKGVNVPSVGSDFCDYSISGY
ncbi:MAG: hypothetical protein LBT38_12245, partial [Deltaproteobacteria bacterium]|nr:hypothetical protein [Deltaproteobacteria bacterium]